MDTPRRCPRCGTELTAGSPEQLCPRCLLQAGFESQAKPSSPPTAAYAPGPAAPTVEELRRFFPQLEILELVGKGGMGAVYKARQPGLDRLVALKVLPPDAAAGPDFAERFTREARALARLSHPNIVGVFDFGRADGLYFFLMEYVDGVNIRQALRAGNLKAAEALKIVPQICDALQFAHDEGVVHRDIKPENILLDKRGRVKIADFGLAKLLGAKPDHTLTGTRQVMGTPHYMAPEQIQGTRDVDHRADIYSLGVTFYEMLTGELPLGRFAPPSRKVHIDVRLDEVVLRTLEVEPEKRYQQASEVKTDVDQIARSPTQSRPQETPRPETSAAAGSAPALERAVADLLPGDKQAAVRAYREATGAGLPEAMSAVMAIADKHGKNVPVPLTVDLALSWFKQALVIMGVGIWLAVESDPLFGWLAVLAALYWSAQNYSWHLRKSRWSLEGLEDTEPDKDAGARRSAAGTGVREVTPALERVIADLLPDDKVAAVRLYREATRARLPEAMSAVKAIAEKHGKNVPVPLRAETVVRSVVGALVLFVLGIWLGHETHNSLFRVGGFVLAVCWLAQNYAWHRRRSRWSLEDLEDTEPEEHPPGAENKQAEADRSVTVKGEQTGREELLPRQPALATAPRRQPPFTEELAVSSKAITDFRHTAGWLLGIGIAVVLLGFAFAAAASFLDHLLRREPFPRRTSLVVLQTISIVEAIACTIGGFLIIRGARAARALRDLRRVRRAAVLALIPFSPLWPLTLPVGIKIFRHLRRPEVALAFEKTRRLSEIVRQKEASAPGWAFVFGWLLGRLSALFRLRGFAVLVALVGAGQLFNHWFEIEVLPAGAAPAGAWAFYKPHGLEFWQGWAVSVGFLALAALALATAGQPEARWPGLILLTGALTLTGLIAAVIVEPPLPDVPEFRQAAQRLGPPAERDARKGGVHPLIAAHRNGEISIRWRLKSGINLALAMAATLVLMAALDLQRGSARTRARPERS
jgi:predicted Ser/Thr protein kinase/ribosomal protein L7/L12